MQPTKPKPRHERATRDDFMPDMIADTAYLAELAHACRRVRSCDDDGWASPHDRALVRECGVEFTLNGGKLS